MINLFIFIAIDPGRFDVAYSFIVNEAGGNGLGMLIKRIKNNKKCVELRLLEVGTGIAKSSIALDEYSFLKWKEN